ncbi:MAG: hypothetical protein J6V26_04840 [Alistipes sp.]|nr:hypothetical protein [Alistipes sp.]
MKKLALLFLSALCFGLMGCEPEPAPTPDPTPDPTPEEVQPTITLEKGLENVNSVTFTVATTDATEARYMVLLDEEEAPSLDTIMAEGVAVELTEGKAEVKAEGLEAETSYKVVAAAKNVTKVAGSNTLYVTTTAQAQVELDVELVQVAHTSINFRYTVANAEKVAYLVQNATKEIPEASEVIRKGDELDPESKEAVEVKDLDPSKEYVLLVAAEGAGKCVMVQEAFTTKDDPSNVIEHNYTRVRGSKYSSNYFIMFSYEDANEADNFAYNDKTLSLDFYGDPEKDYLPAGTYEVKESTDFPCVNCMKYSTYGYDNGVLLKSGVVEVAIDPETKAYTFAIDVQLKDGRHLVANYTGDVDNMPVIDIVTVTTTCTVASATTADEGKTWELTLADAEGNKAVFNLANAFDAPYIAKNTYTISTSAEEFSAKRAAAEIGQFDSETSYFEVAGKEGQFKFTKGTLNVDIDWTNQKYFMTFYGELENGYKIELEFNDAVEGVSLAPSEEIVSVVLDSAVRRSPFEATNYYVSFSKSEGGVELYRLQLDLYCPASEFLPAGVYSTKEAVDGCRLDGEHSTLYVTGEGQYYPAEARATVETNMADKTYTFNVSFQIEDGRTFVFSYVGAVDGIEIKEPEVVEEEIKWTTFKAKKLYSDNWELNISNDTGEYKLLFDMRVGDSSLTYIPTHVYVLSESYNAEGLTMYVDKNYSMFNGSKGVFKEVTLNVTYVEASQTYEISFDVTLNTDVNLTGSYTGAVEGSPKVE